MKNKNKATLAKRFGPKITNPEFTLRFALEKTRIPFITQEPIRTGNGYFTVDFLVNHNLVVEVDGSSHFFGKRCYAKTAWRDMELTSAGFKVLHFRNDEVYKELPRVVDVICAEAK